MELIKWQQQQQELANPPLAEASRTHWNCLLRDATSLPTLPSEVAEAAPAERESGRESAPESLREIAKMAKRKWRRDVAIELEDLVRFTQAAKHS